MRKILIIEDQTDHFERMKALLESVNYSVLPEDPKEMFQATDPVFAKCCKESIEQYAVRQILENKDDICLVLCDIKLGNDAQGGGRVVRYIRNVTDVNISFLVSMIPIIGITQYADNQDNLMISGADCVYAKPPKEQTPSEFSSGLLRSIIDAQVNRYEIRKNHRYPVKLIDEIGRFKESNNGKASAFIMTSFREEHLEIAKKIKKILDKHGIIGYLASEGEGGKNDDDLWPNIEVYMHGCDFGIGIYADDEILRDDDSDEEMKKARINPNMSQEVGYMLALQKPVCILKDQNLKKIPTDLAGRIYVQYSEKNLGKKLNDWLKSKGIV